MKRQAAAVLVMLVGLAGLAAVWLGLLSPTPPAAAQGIRIGHPAPDVAGKPWINTAPLTIQALRGRVVLVEFWTYG